MAPRTVITGGRDVRRMYQPHISGTSRVHLAQVILVDQGSLLPYMNKSIEREIVEHRHTEMNRRDK